MDPVSIIVAVVMCVGGFGGFWGIGKMTDKMNAQQQIVLEQANKRMAEEVERQRLAALEAKTQLCDDSTHEVIAAEIEKYGEAVTVCACDWCANQAERETAERLMRELNAKHAEAQAEAQRFLNEAQSNHQPIEDEYMAAREQVDDLTKQVELYRRQAYVATMREQAGLDPLPGQAENAALLNSKVQMLAFEFERLDAATDVYKVSKNVLETAEREHKALAGKKDVSYKKIKQSHEWDQYDYNIKQYNRYLRDINKALTKW